MGSINYKFNIDKKLRNVNAVSFLIAIAISLTISIVVLSSPSSIFSKSVTIMNIAQKEQSEVIFRGLSIDGQWYNPSTLSPEGDWKYSSIDGTYHASDDTPITIQVPLGKDVQFVFNVGPQAGIVELSIGTNVIVHNLYHEEFILDGHRFSFPEANTALMVMAVDLSAVAIFTFIVGFILLLSYSNYKNKIPWSKVEKFFVISLVPVSFCFLLIFSLSSNPFIEDFWGYDGAVYALLGKGTNQGLIPYLDLFEHKGPLTFFLYGFGYAMDETWGIFILQSIFLSITLLCAYLIGKERRGEISTGIWAVVATLVYFTIVIDEGALVEEFNLPLLMFSTLLIVRYFKSFSKRVAHPPKYAFIYGITFGVSLCLRVTNSIAICVFVFCIALLLLLKRKFKNLLYNGGAFCLGFGVVVIPFIIYFAIHGALYDMLYGTILHNIEYSSESITHSISEWKTILIYISPVVLCALFSLKKNYIERLCMVAVFISFVILFGGTRLYPHYYVILMPFISVLIGYLSEISELKKSASYLYKISYSLIVVLGCLVLFNFIYTEALGKAGWVNWSKEHPQDIQYTTAIKTQGNLIPLEDRGEVIAFGVMADWYLLTDIMPCDKNFFYRGESNDRLTKIYEEEIDFYKSLEAKWVVLNESTNIPEIKEIVEKNYYVFDTAHVDKRNYDLILYRRKF